MDFNPASGNLWLEQNGDDTFTDTPQEAFSRMFMLPGAEDSDPEFNWKSEVAPAGLGFLTSRFAVRRSVHDGSCVHKCGNRFRECARLDWFLDMYVETGLESAYAIR